MDKTFKQAVCEVVGKIPRGRVMTYGDIAALCGYPLAARQVGGIAHFGPTELPWHRVVNRLGEMATGYYGGKQGHQQALEDEGVTVENFHIIGFEERRWRP